MEDLQDQLAGALAEEDEAVPAVPFDGDASAPFPQSVDDLMERATKLLWARKRRLSDVARVNAHCDAQVEAIEQWRQRRIGGPLADVAQIERLLEGYARAALSGSKRRSVALVPGTLKLRAPGRGQTLVVDEEEVIRHAFMADHPGWVERRPKVKAARVREETGIGRQLPVLPDQPPGVDRFELVDRSTGEVVPGVVALVESQDRFSIADSDADLEASPYEDDEVEA